MLPTSNRAFKEWAVICRALAEGRQILILRKGGIAEGRRGFEVTDSEFFLFPTFSHQAPESVVPEWRDAIERCEEPETGTVVLSHYAVVADWTRIESMETLRALRDLHVWSDEEVEERFHRWSEAGLFILAVRAFELPRPVSLEMNEEYTGCKSWVTLLEQVPLAGARPILEDAPFDRLLESFRSTVGR